MSAARDTTSAADAAAESVSTPGPLGVSCRALFAARDSWDLSVELTPAEREGLQVVAQWARHFGRWTNELHATLARLLGPIDAVTMLDGNPVWGQHETRRLLLRAMHEHQSVCWTWDRSRWVEVASTAGSQGTRQALLRVAYVLAGQYDLHRSFPNTKRRQLTGSLLGVDEVEAALTRIRTHLEGLGFQQSVGSAALVASLLEVMLQERSTHLEDFSGITLSMDHFAESNHWLRAGLAHLGRILASMGIGDVRFLAPPDTTESWLARTTAARVDVPVEWAEWAQRWYRTSPLIKRSREQVYYALLKVGRWLAASHPEVISPDQWDRELAADWIATVTRMNVGEYSHAPSTVRYAERVGKPLSARSRHQHITLMGRFMRDCQDWGWTRLTFDPVRTFRTPRSVLALIGPDPRVVADDVWAKLLWAGLNLTVEDLPAHGHSRFRTGYEGKPWYPLEMVRGVALLWLFSGLRVNEILRLRVGCVRWQTSHDQPAVNGQTRLDVCLVDVPVTKTSTTFTKPIDPVVGHAIDAWHHARPAQPFFVDPKTGETVDMLFAVRGVRMSAVYINRVLSRCCAAKRTSQEPTCEGRSPATGHAPRSRQCSTTRKTP